jgi:hypothetical protein
MTDSKAPIPIDVAAHNAIHQLVALYGLLLAEREHAIRRLEMAATALASENQSLRVNLNERDNRIRDGKAENERLIARLNGANLEYVSSASFNEAAIITPAIEITP